MEEQLRSVSSAVTRFLVRAVFGPEAAAKSPVGDGYFLDEHFFQCALRVDTFDEALMEVCEFYSQRRMVDNARLVVGLKSQIVILNREELGGLKLDFFGLGDSTRCVKYLQGYEVALTVVIQDYARLIFVTFSYGALLQNQG